MTEPTLTAFAKLTDAEEYFHFFQLPYDPTLVSVNRLHILRKFSLLKREIDRQNTDPQQILALYRSALESAYSVFLTSSSYEQKLFKVFQTPPPSVVLLSDITLEEEETSV